MNDKQVEDSTFFGVMDMAWLEDNVAVTFHTTQPYHSSSPEEIIQSLRLNTLNSFLEQRGFTLQSSTSLNVPSPLPPDEEAGDREEDIREEEENPLEALLEELTEGGVEAFRKSMKKLEELVMNCSTRERKHLMIHRTGILTTYQASTCFRHLLMKAPSPCAFLISDCTKNLTLSRT